MFEERYLGQVRLLIAVLPFIVDEPCFALKGALPSISSCAKCRAFRWTLI